MHGLCSFNLGLCNAPKPDKIQAMETKQASISVVIPVYNSEQSLPPLIEQLGEALQKIAPEFEVILVNDGSKDHSWAAMESLAAQELVVQPTPELTEITGPLRGNAIPGTDSSQANLLVLPPQLSHVAL